jgi:integrase
MYYLGKHGSEASRREYDRIIGEYIAHGRQAFCDPEEILVEHLIIAFLDYVDKERNYSKSSAHRIRLVLARLNSLYGKTRVSQFTPVTLKTIRRQYLEQNLSRRTINAYIWIIQQVFAWGAEEELVPAAVNVALKTVKKLKSGHSSAREYAPVGPVPDEVVEKTIPYLEPQYQDMVRVQRWIGGRPQDLHNMRVCDIDRSKDIWIYTPYQHKTMKQEKVRLLPLGPKSQKVLLPYLEKCQDNPEQFVFPRSGKKQYAKQYVYAIEQACKKAGVPKWTPNQLRHAAGTEIRAKYGLDYAQATLGHARAQMTETYAGVLFEKAVRVAREMG